jgi:hypothetical protein
MARDLLVLPQPNGDRRGMRLETRVSPLFAQAEHPQLNRAFAPEQSIHA